ncbi:MAG: hypothetical protein ACE5JC_10775 [Candidatus Zixiibacteriota bacterium]
MTQVFKYGNITYWIVGRRFANLEPELSRVLQPLPEVRVIVDRRVQDRLPEWTVYSEALGAWSLADDREKKQCWIVDRRFANLEPELRRILQPLPEVRPVIDRRSRDRLPEWTVYSEALGAWPLVDEREKKQYWIVARRFADLEHELTRILRTLPEMRVMIDRRVRERPPEGITYSEDLGAWSISDDREKTVNIYQGLEEQSG